MGYIDDHLLAGEQVKYRTSLHWITLAGPASVLLLGILVMATSSGVIGTYVAILGAVWFGARWLGRSTSEFGITNKRVLIKVGILRRRSVETLLTKVEGIGVDQGIFGRMWGYGSIVVTGTGGTREPFHQIAEPMEFRRQVQEQIEHREAART